VNFRLLLLVTTCCVCVGAHAHDTGASATAASPSADVRHAAAASPRERAAQLFFSDRQLQTQDGRDVAFYSDVLKDNVVLINFFYTQCTDSCPTESAKLEGVQALLRANPRAHVRLVSISVDPTHDSPTALAAYAAQWHAGHEWLFLTGTQQNVDDVLRRLGQLVAERNAHTSLFIVGNSSTGHWLKLHPDAPAATIAAELTTLADESPTHEATAAAARPKR